MTARLIHLNGAPGVGKSTLAQALVASRPGWLNLDIDVLRSLIGGWEGDFLGTGSVVRPLALAMVSVHLDARRTVVLGWAQRLRDGYATRPDVTTLDMEGLSVNEAAAVLAARIDGRSVPTPWRSSTDGRGTTG